MYLQIRDAIFTSSSLILIVMVNAFHKIIYTIQHRCAPFTEHSNNSVDHCHRYNGNQDDHSITLAFSKKEIEGRKEWLTNFMEEGKRRKELSLPEVYLYEKVNKCCEV